MSVCNRLAALAAAGALAVVAPAAAKPMHPTHPSQPPTSHKCARHNVAYIASGRFVSWTATQNADGTWSGTIIVHVTRSNHHVSAVTSGGVTYTLNKTRVTFGHGATPPAAGDPVHARGKISELAKKCTQTGFTPVITVHKLNIHVTKQ